MNTAVELELDLQIACDAANLPTEHHFRLWAEVVLQGLCDEAELSIRLIDESESAQLNMQYRQKSGATNVLSFPADLPPELELSLLGDLAICKQVVEREADEQHKACLDHWAHMVIHGTLHLLGYDHIDDDEAHEMETLEVALLKTLNISNPYTPIL